MCKLRMFMALLALYISIIYTGKVEDMLEKAYLTPIEIVPYLYVTMVLSYNQGKGVVWLEQEVNGLLRKVLNPIKIRGSTSILSLR